jgi:hypothetical protein
MEPDKATVLAQIDDVLAGFDRASGASPHNDFSGGLSDAELQAIATRMMAAIARLAPPDSTYLTKASLIEGHNGYVVREIGGILQALRADVEAGYVQSLSELVRADLFADFLEMADELQQKGYKDAAAVVTGSVLEEHLRKRASKSGVALGKANGAPKTADSLNNELASAGVYNKLQQKSVTAWLDLRNKAAHGHYAEYDDGQVAALIRDVREFLIRLPA